MVDSEKFEEEKSSNSHSNQTVEENQSTDSSQNMLESSTSSNKNPYIKIKNSRNVEETINDLVSGSVQVEDFPYIQVCIIDDIIFSSDYR
ncbi:27622_t:CDS:2 [Racocetra persica]|uniref:27622_t:CDS:1 n=1 Tax=Racocetra persica TaxID=160502 RepID=A0ACA9M9Q0_9GLOM|nr:27622_t:CDS:2 [Racocetra persica]